MPAVHSAGRGSVGVPRTTLIRAGGGFAGIDLAELWRARELLYFLTLRELKLRYKQTAIGIAWAVLQPLLAAAIFTVIFGIFAKMPSGGAPYPVFALSAVLPWTYFAEAVRRSSTGLVGDSELIRKVYFPRLVVPLAMVLSPLADFFVGLVLLIALCAWYGIAPSAGLIFLPAFLVIAIALALAVSLWLGPLSVRFRDVMHTLPFLLQVWLYASPVAYPASVVPEKWRLLYSLNPMVGVVDGFRWVLLGTARPDLAAIGVSSLFVAAALLGGLIYFRRMERSFADII
jgi:lipopolysaccharide transport system permease protein